jgi:hypothetical protein
MYDSEEFSLTSLGAVLVFPVLIQLFFSLSHGSTALVSPGLPWSGDRFVSVDSDLRLQGKVCRRDQDHRVPVQPLEFCFFARKL